MLHAFSEPPSADPPEPCPPQPTSSRLAMRRPIKTVRIMTPLSRNLRPVEGSRFPADKARILPYEVKYRDGPRALQSHDCWPAFPSKLLISSLEHLARSLRR